MTTGTMTEPLPGPGDPEQTTVVGLRCEGSVDPHGLHTQQPRLAWRLASTRRGVRQSAYQVRVVRDDEDRADATGVGASSAGEPGVADPAGTLLWDSGRVDAARTSAVPYAGPPLRSRDRLRWRVRAWDGDTPTPWSDEARWEMGLLSPDDWHATWIGPSRHEDPRRHHPTTLLRRELTLPEAPVRARAYVTAQGLYHLTVNGTTPAHHSRFAPGYTQYDTRLQYQAYDVTPLLHAGENAVGVVLADGWHRGALGPASRRNVWGERLGLLLQLEVVLADGTVRRLASDGDWRTASGPHLLADLKLGESYDARLERAGWDLPGFDDGDWPRAARRPDPGVRLDATHGPPVTAHEVLPAQRILRTPSGQTVVDFGQNLVGTVRFTVDAPRGTTVRLHHGEVLDARGDFTTSHMRLPWHGEYQVVRYTSAGGGPRTHEASFSSFGFRYVELVDWPTTPAVEDVAAVVLQSAVPRTGRFACSDERVTRLHENVVWSTRGNLVEIPTDCPTRERLGWTGDIQVFARTAAFLVDTQALLERWLVDLAAAQRADGCVPHTVPDDFGAGARLFPPGSAGWGDAAVVVPWVLYQAHGDPQTLSRQYPSMRAWVEFTHARAARRHWTRRLRPDRRTTADRERDRYVVDTGYHWGEWLEPDTTGPLDLVRTALHNHVLSRPEVATAYHAYSTGLVAEAAAVLGYEADARRYAERHRRIVAAYQEAFVGRDGRMRPDRQAPYVRALALGLAPDDRREAMVGHLVRLVEAAGDHLDTGFLSTPHLCQVLSDHGRLDVAYRLLRQDTQPSWLYAVDRGATTVWESWNGVSPDGRPHSSHNHYSPGAVASWLHRVVAGLDPDEPGYTRSVVRPRPGGGLDWAEASVDTGHGTLACRWDRTPDGTDVHVVVPATTEARVVLPSARLADVTESGDPLHGPPDGSTLPAGLVAARQTGPDVEVLAGSGDYRFRYPSATAASTATEGSR